MEDKNKKSNEFLERVWNSNNKNVKHSRKMMNEIESLRKESKKSNELAERIWNSNKKNVKYIRNTENNFEMIKSNNINNVPEHISGDRYNRDLNNEENNVENLEKINATSTGANKNILTEEYLEEYAYKIHETEEFIDQVFYEQMEGIQERLQKISEVLDEENIPKNDFTDINEIVRLKNENRDLREALDILAEKYNKRQFQLNKTIFKYSKILEKYSSLLEQISESEDSKTPLEIVEEALEENSIKEEENTNSEEE